MKFKFNNITYDILKKVALRYMPAVITLWLTISKIWNLPYGVEIGATLGAVNLCLGECLGVSSSNYYNDNKEE